MAPLFVGDDEEFQGLIRDHLILSYLFGDFRPSHIQEYAAGLLLELEKPPRTEVLYAFGFTFECVLACF